jgi:hypothetical protein
MLTSKEFLVVAPVVVGCVLIFAFSIWLLPAIYGYKISDDKVEVMLFGILPIVSVNSGDIVEVRRERSWALLFYSPFRTLRMGNCFTNESVVVVRRGFSKYVVFTPENVDEFYSSLRTIAPLARRHSHS